MFRSNKRSCCKSCTFHMKSVMMDVVVADITPKFGMFLLRSWEKAVGGTLQMDFSYSTIPIFGGEQRRLYREVQLAYLESDNNNPTALLCITSSSLLQILE